MKRKLIVASLFALTCSISVGCSNSESNVTGVQTKNISGEQAKEIALNHAGLSKNDVTFLKENVEYDDGLKCYDVEFYNNLNEYDYKIDAQNGSILEYDSDIEGYTSQQANNTTNNNSNNISTNNSSVNSTTTNVIGEESAKKIALNHAGINENQVSYINVHLDMDNGVQVYEIEVYSNNIEYNY